MCAVHQVKYASAHWHLFHFLKFCELPSEPKCMAQRETQTIFWRKIFWFSENFVGKLLFLLVYIHSFSLFIVVLVAILPLFQTELFFSHRFQHWMRSSNSANYINTFSHELRFPLHYQTNFSFFYYCWSDGFYIEIFNGDSDHPKYWPISCQCAS